MSFPTLPMGTIMSVVMLLCALALAVFPPQRSPRGAMRALRVTAGALAGLGGLWQLAWYAARHIGTFWGSMAALSGIALLAAATLLLPRSVSSCWRHARLPCALLLLGIAVFYALTIARL